MARTITHYRHDDLPLQPAVPGARQWAVALNQTMLTYFAIEPDSRFAMHSHDNEQITLVL